MRQITNHILMVKPTGFNYNAETAANNHFQHSNLNFSNKEIAENATREFDNMVELLDLKGVNIKVVDPIGNKYNPDAVFPNNWFSIHQNGTKVLYPMFAESRRTERNNEIFSFIEKELDFKIKTTVDLTSYENDLLFLEGTGSMILDRVNKIAYAAISERTSPQVLEDFALKMNYQTVSFNSFHKNAAIYHTNVMMCLGEDFVLICLESIGNEKEKMQLLESFEHTNKELIEISSNQIDNFAGNMLQIEGKDHNPLIVMSQAAFSSLEKHQLKTLERNGEIVFSSLSTIEKFGGGSARCMMAELFI